ncbi:MAG: hypothetical protein KGK34_00580 [Chloroflexota bacterium]|nr:hypothetical protein [Chloroflexota bacterium]
MTVRPAPAAARQRPPASRRAPVDWRRYAAQARRARSRLPRSGHPLVVRLVVSLLFTLAGLALLDLAGVGIGAGFADLGSAVGRAVPQPTTTDLVLGAGSVSVAAAPILDPLPDFTKNTSVALSGKVPGFALTPTRRISVSVDGKSIGTATIAPDGRFGPTTIALVDGANTVKATLVDGSTEVASTSATVTVDRVPPTLTVASPKPGDTVTAPDVTLSGTTEPGASLIVNDQVIHPNPDGSFTDRLTGVPAGPLTITIVATDKAGNETKTQLSLTVKPAASAAPVGLTLGVTLDRTTVRPGATVVAQIVAADGGKPRADLPVTLQVGVITIGTYRTDATGTVRVGFAAPDQEVQAATVLVLGGGVSATATLAVAASAP